MGRAADVGEQRRVQRQGSLSDTASRGHDQSSERVSAQVVHSTAARADRSTGAAVEEGKGSCRSRCTRWQKLDRYGRNQHALTHIPSQQPHSKECNRRCGYTWPRSVGLSCAITYARLTPPACWWAGRSGYVGVAAHVAIVTATRLSQHADYAADQCGRHYNGSIRPAYSSSLHQHRVAAANDAIRRLLSINRHSLITCRARTVALLHRSPARLRHIHRLLLPRPIQQHSLPTLVQQPVPTQPRERYSRYRHYRRARRTERFW